VIGVRTHVSHTRVQKRSVMSAYPTNREDLSPNEPRATVDSKSQPPVSRNKKRLAVLISSTSYPLLGVALWVGSARGLWAVAAIIAALAVVMSFLGWDLYGEAERDDTGLANETAVAKPSVDIGAIVALGVKLSAILIIVSSYAVVGVRYGFPIPETLLGWVVPLSVLLFAAFAILRSES
jgi:hypothetical protein